jgi:uncharacterized protein (TIGR03067 family)
LFWRFSMSRPLLPVLVVGVLAAVELAAAADEKADVKKELKKFEGTWVRVSAETNGKEAPKEVVKSIAMTFAGDKFTIKVADKERVIAGTFRIDPSKDPKGYDATASPAGKERTTVGIYQFDRDRLKVCYTPEGGKRPEEFSSKGGTDDHPVYFEVYRRQKDK